ncbi:hypothetical protein VTO42DRAFT_4280 [Malbranchea cinnamomea]
MFSSALKSFNSNISANYHISSNPAFISGPWKVHDGKRKSTGASASVFIFDRKSLEPRMGGFGSRSNSSSLRKLHEEVVERLKKEASNLARLRHPSILQILEPLEEIRNGGLMFVTEPVTASLGGLLLEKDEQERGAGVGAGERASRYMSDEPEGTRRRDTELDELEIQKGLLQVGKGLEFLHESAGLVHGNLNPEAIYVNSKSDWKISGLSFAGPAESESGLSLSPTPLSEVLYHDPRLPSSVQLKLDYSSPDLVMDSNITPAADLFSLGLIIIALYNSPHTSPLHTNNNPTTYKKLLSSPATTPTQQNSFLCSRAIPKDLQLHILPKLITRRPAQRMNAKEFQQSPYFDNVLVSTIRFLESFPAKTPNEKSQFMRGLSRVLPEFPSSVLERKVLVALLEEMKDRDLLPLILQNVFQIISKLPSSRRVVPEKVIPRFKETFIPSSIKNNGQERDISRDAGLLVILENIRALAINCAAKKFKEDVLPLVFLGLESNTHSLVDAALRCLPAILPILDFSTVKDELFPPIASVFARTSSLLIKVRGLESFVLLCGGSNEPTPTRDDLSGIFNESRSKPSSSSILDKYTIQEKLVPLLKAIKTREPAVMMAALKVLQQIGEVADTEFVALEILPILWTFSLGPLLNVRQFASYMDLIRSLSSKIEREHTKKLQELASSDASGGRGNLDSTSGVVSMSVRQGTRTNTDENAEFERLVLGGIRDTKPVGNVKGIWESSHLPLTNTATHSTPQFSWSSTAESNSSNSDTLTGKGGQNTRSITPDMNMSSFPALQPMAKQRPSQMANATSWDSPGRGMKQDAQASNFYASSSLNPSSPNIMSWGQMNSNSSTFTIPPPPSANAPLTNAPSLGHTQFPVRPANSGMQTNQMSSTQEQKQGLDKYESLL